jgi:hypothetical protein
MSKTIGRLCTLLLFVVYLGGLFLFIAGEIRENFQRELYGLIAMVGVLAAAVGWSFTERGELAKRVETLENQLTNKTDGQPTDAPDKK